MVNVLYVHDVSIPVISLPLLAEYSDNFLFNILMHERGYNVNIRGHTVYSQLVHFSGSCFQLSVGHSFLPVNKYVMMIHGVCVCVCACVCVCV